MNELCSSFVNLDLEMAFLEDQFLTPVPYDSDDPDFLWHQHVDSEPESEGDCVVVSETETLMDKSSKHKSKRKSRKRHNSGSLTPKKESTRKVFVVPEASPMGASPQNGVAVHFPLRNVQARRNHAAASPVELSNSDSDISESIEAIRRRRQLFKTKREENAQRDLNTDHDNLNTMARLSYPLAGYKTPIRQQELSNHPTSATNNQPTGYPNNWEPAMHNLNSTVPQYRQPRISRFSLPSESSRFNRRSYGFKSGSSTDRSSTDSADQATRPMYRNHQFLGDSQLVRFSEQLLNCRRYVTFTEDTRSRRLGYCVSGQKIRDLELRLLSKEYKLARKVIMLIGTNDMVYGTDLQSMCERYESILKFLTEQTDRIVIMTVPPVAKFVNDERHWSKLQQFNEFIMGCADRNQIFAIDIASLYISYCNGVSTDYYEQVFSGKHPRPDLIHLNTLGFKMLRSLLDNKYFDQFGQD